MFSVDVEVDVVDQGFEVSVMVIFVFLMDFFLHEFKLAATDLTVTNEISENLDSSVDIPLEDLETERADFSSSVG
jgi:hypothetical protein